MDRLILTGIEVLTIENPEGTREERMSPQYHRLIPKVFEKPVAVPIRPIASMKEKYHASFPNEAATHIHLIFDVNHEDTVVVKETIAEIEEAISNYSQQN